MTHSLRYLRSNHHALLHQWLRRREKHAEKLGIRTPTTSLHLYECAACQKQLEQEAPWDIDSIQAHDIPKLLEIMAEALSPTRCPHCGSRDEEAEHLVSFAFAYLSASQTHLAWLYCVDVPHDDLPSPAFTLLEYNGETTKVVKPREQRTRFHRLVAQDSVRRSLSIDPEMSPDALRKRYQDDRESQLLALREFGVFWESLSEYSKAYSYFDAYLEISQDDEQVLYASARILERALEYPEASRRMHRAWMQSESPELLDDLARLAYRAQRFDLLKGAATVLLDADPDSITGYLALVSSLEARHLVPLRRAFRALHDAAATVGHIGIQHVCDSILQRLTLNLPDWERGLSREDYRSAITRRLSEDGYNVEGSRSLQVEGTAIEYDLLIEAPDGQRTMLFLHDGPVRPHIVRALRGQLRILFAHDDWAAIHPLFLSPRPLPWYVYRMLSTATDARLELMADADTTMHVIDENVATFLWIAEKHYGASLDFSVETLPELDRLIGRWHEFGFGEISHVMACLMASYLGEVFRRHLGGQWVDAHNGPDARAWQLPDETTIYLIAHVRHCVALGQDETIASFVQNILRGER